MNRICILFLAVIFGQSCWRQDNNNHQKIQAIQIETVQKKYIFENITFDFIAKKMNTINDKIKVDASLFNLNSDTVFFLTSSCDGLQYSLQYDSSKFILTPFLYCEFSRTIIAKIAPHDKLDFVTYFSNIKSTTIELGFDFYKVDKLFDVKNSPLNIYQRAPKDKTVIWAKAKTVR